MKKILKVLLLSAILSNIFTPCFSEESSPAAEIARLPLAAPVEYTKEDTLEKESAPSNEEVPSTDTTAAEDFKDTKPDENSVVNLVDEEETTSSSCPDNPILVQRSGTIEAFKTTYKCLAGRELTAMFIEKGRTFEVKSLQPMSYESTGGSEVQFETLYPERVFMQKDPMKLVFTGEIVKNKPPRKGGGSGTLKVLIKNVKLENVIYPAEAYITKMNKKGVLFGAVAIPSNYKDNLADTANDGTIHTIYKDPCKTTADECVDTVVRPFYFLTGALLQTADLLLAPIVAFFMPGNEVFIPEGTEFEIKMEKDIPVLEI